MEPKSNATEDVRAAERAMQMEVSRRQLYEDVGLIYTFALQFGWWTHPIFSTIGDYPSVMINRIGNISLTEGYRRSRLPAFSEREVEFVRGTQDFMGLNHYTTRLVSDNEYPDDAATSHAKDVGVRFEYDPSWKNSSASWLKVVPWGFRKLLNWIRLEYGNPLIYVTENGYADDGRLEDVDRIYYHSVSDRKFLPEI